MKKIAGHFRDSFNFDAVQKTAISMRDGVIEYYGAEIGMTPADRIFKVYRSPATIANAAVDMQGVPLTLDHVSVDMPVTDACGSVLKSRMIDLKADDTASTVGVLNSLDVAADALGTVMTGKREMSLGYRANLFEMPPESGYDFEQRDIVPHHLAIVDAGRCGSVCSFVDHKSSEGIQDMKKTKLHKAFADAEGNPSMTDIVAVINGLPDAVAALPIDELQKVMPTLQAIVGAHGGAINAEGETQDENPSETEAPAADADPANPETPAADADPEKDKKMFGDKKAFSDAVQKQVAEHMEIVDRARQFLPENYNFKGKSARQIMTDAVKTEHPTTKFSDSELNVAFKLLKKPESNYKDFGKKMTSAGKFSDHVNQQ